MPDEDLSKLTPHKDGKRRKMIMTKLTAVALTSHGANPEANVTFFKSKDKPEDTSVEKRSFLTTGVEGHAHLITIGDRERFQMAGETSWQDGHTHPFVINDDGSITVGEADGHVNTIDVNVSAFLKAEHQDDDEDEDDTKATKSGAEDDKSKASKSNAADIGGGQEHKEKNMPDDKNADTKAAKELEALKAKLAKAELLATLTDPQKVFLKNLNEADQDTFLNKSINERNDEIDLAKSADAVVYKSTSGIEYRRSDDPRLVALAKERDEDRVELNKQRADNEALVYKNRAIAEMGNMPGTVETHVAILKSFDAIEDKETRDAAMSALKAKNTSFAGALETVGTTELPTVSKSKQDANATMDDLTKKYVADHPEFVEKYGNSAYYEAYEIVSKANPETLQKAMAG